MRVEMKKFLLITVLSAIAAFGMLYWWFGISYVAPSISTIDAHARQAIVGAHDQTILAEVVKTEAEQARGLGERTSIGVNEGMLFLFPKPGNYGFWMKDMYFPIDIVWIASSTVVGVSADVPPPLSMNVPDNSLPVYYPPALADAVLELHADRAAILSLKAGDILSIKPLLPNSKILQ